jgi:alpha-L-rhamnosidase
MGATTIWERWDGQKTDSTFQDAGMNSFNHYAYGAIGDWMYRVSAGIETMSPGYKHLKIQPQPTKKLNYANATFESPYGIVASGWERKDGKIIVRVTIPANTKATVILPVDDPAKVTENGSPLSTDKSDFVIIEEYKEGNRIGLVRGSGQYNFEFTE